MPSTATIISPADLPDVLAAVGRNVQTYGAKGDGVTDNTASIDAALADGFPVVFPPGVYKTRGGHTLLPGQAIQGWGKTSVIANTSATGDTFTVGNATYATLNNVVRGLTFTPAAVRTGNEITVNCGLNVTLADLDFNGVYRAMMLGGANALVTAFVTNIRGITFTQLVRMVRVLDGYFVNLSSDAKTAAATTLYLDGGCEGNTFTNFDFTNQSETTPTGVCCHVLKSAYTASPARYNTFAGGNFDAHLYGYFDEDGVSNQAQNCWSFAHGTGVILGAGSSWARYVNGTVSGCGSDGMIVGGRNQLVDGVSVTGNNISQQGYSGIHVVGSCTGAKIVNCDSRNDGPNAPGPQQYGIQIDAGADGLIVTGNDTRGNAVGGINNLAGVGDTKIVANNL